MKTQNGLVWLYFALLIGCLTACQTKSNKPAENPIAFDTVEIEKSYHMMDNPDNPNCNLQINFTFPIEMDNDSLLKKTQRHFVTAYFGEPYEQYTPQEVVGQYVEDYLDAYKEMEEDFRAELELEDPGPMMSWFSYFEMSTNEILYNRDGLLSFAVSYENYTGGAHGAHSYRAFVIDLATGELLTEEDIFVENFQERLAKLMVMKLAEENELTDPLELENIGYFSIDEIYPNGNLSVDDKGITYTFNEYEIAAYVVGQTHLFFPFREIKHLMKEQSPVAVLMN